MYIYIHMFNLQWVFQTTCCPEQFPHLVSLHLPVVHAILSAVTHQEDTMIQLSASPETIGGGFKPWNKYESNWITSPIFRVKNKQYLKPPQILSKKHPKSHQFLMWFLASECGRKKCFWSTQRTTEFCVSEEIQRWGTSTFVGLEVKIAASI